ncbi:MAG: hypothetical protein ABSA02_34150 [Trebonia sp.]
MAVEPRVWIGPALGPDSAAELMAAMGRWSASQLRELAPQPFGLVNDELRLPVSVGSFGLEGSAGPSAPLTSMTLCYGIREDPLSPYIEVSTDFTPGHKAVALRFELGRAAGRLDPRLADGLPWGGGRGHRPPKGPLGRGRAEIVVAGLPRTAHTQIYRDFHGLQFRHSGLPVTAIARGRWPDQPKFELITDLEPHLAATESADSEVIRARFVRFPDGPPS